MIPAFREANEAVMRRFVAARLAIGMTVPATLLARYGMTEPTAGTSSPACAGAARASSNKVPSTGHSTKEG